MAGGGVGGDPRNAYEAARADERGAGTDELLGATADGGWGQQRVLTAHLHERPQQKHEFSNRRSFSSSESILRPSSPARVHSTAV